MIDDVPEHAAEKRSGGSKSDHLNVNLVVSLEPDQIERILSGLSKPKPRVSSQTKTAAVVSLVAVICGGLFVFFKYVDTERDASQTTTQGSELDNALKRKSLEEKTLETKKSMWAQKCAIYLYDWHGAQGVDAESDREGDLVERMVFFSLSTENKGENRIDVYEAEYRLYFGEMRDADSEVVKLSAPRLTNPAQSEVEHAIAWREINAGFDKYVEKGGGVGVYGHGEGPKIGRGYKVRLREDEWVGVRATLKRRDGPPYHCSKAVRADELEPSE